MLRQMPEIQAPYDCGTNFFETLPSLAAMRRFASLIWRLFGLNIAVLSADGRKFTSSGHIGRVNPFCAAMQRSPKLRSLCLASDQAGLARAIGRRSPCCYQCFAGLREFVAPVLVNRQIVAIILSGQILDRPPNIDSWNYTRVKLQQFGIPDWRVYPLQPVFMRSPWLVKSRQRDVALLLSLFAEQLARLEMQKNGNPARMPLAVRAQALIGQQYNQPLPLKEIAARLNVSERHLERIFHTATGSSVLNYLQKTRVETAREELAKTRNSCAEIAFACGFGSIQQFNRVFKAQTGFTPGAWRRRACHGRRGPAAQSTQAKTGAG